MKNEKWEMKNGKWEMGNGAMDREGMDKE